MKYLQLELIILAAVAGVTPAVAQFQGPSTGSTPYALPSQPNVNTYSLLTVDNTGANPDDSIGGYGMAGIPDGLGAYDNGDGTFTVLMNHELPNTSGVTRAHGATGAFVSKWVIDKNTLVVDYGADLVTQVATWNSGLGAYNAPTTGIQISRLCSADLPAVSAYAFGALGTAERIFMSGEEIAGGRAFAHIATGANAGISYELPYFGKFAWENAVASPYSQTKTVVIGTDDTTPGQAYLYVGTKTNTGNEVQKAGLSGGNLYGIKVSGSFSDEIRTGPGAAYGLNKGDTAAFTTINLGDVSNRSGATLQADSETAGVSEFLRPEDGAWSKDGTKFYFVTTDRYDQVKDGVGTQVARSRLWELAFGDITNPENGGNIKLLLDGTEAINMMDNMTVDASTGNILVVEDVGGQAHNGKLWLYGINDGSLTELAKHDPARFGDIGQGATAPFSSDEEFSGIIDVTSIMSSSTIPGASEGSWYLMDDQAHYTTGISSAQAEGGQLILVHAIPEPSTHALVLLGMAGAVTMIFRRRFKGAKG